MAQPKSGFAHPYFPTRDPERRWLYKLSLGVPSGISVSDRRSRFSDAGTEQEGSRGTDNPKTEVLSINAQSVTVPSFSVDVITIPHLNQDVKVAGRPTLGDMSVTFLTSYQMQVVAILEGWFRTIYLASEEKLGFAFEYKTNGTFHILYPNLETFKEYNIYGCWPSSIGDKEYDWSASESVTRTVTFHVDKVLDPGDSISIKTGVASLL